MDKDEIRGAAAAIADAESVVALTGAGVSTASGIPDFRGPNGLWQRYDVSDFHVRRFRADPAGFWRDRLEMEADLYGDRAIEPNAAHDALAALDASGYVDTLVTQNVDGLHQEAGHEEVVELHGNGQRVRCWDCGQRSPADGARERAANGELPPVCGECGGTLKPDVVLFGERLPEHARLQAQAATERADVFLVAGSSLEVEPAASLPRTAATRGATLVLVNFDPTPVSDRAEYDFRADVTDALPMLRDAVESN